MFFFIDFFQVNNIYCLNITNKQIKFYCIKKSVFFLFLLNNDLNIPGKFLNQS